MKDPYFKKRLSRSFSLPEFINTSKKGCQIEPEDLSYNQYLSMYYLSNMILQKIRDVKGPIVLTSGFRTDKLNSIVYKELKPNADYSRRKLSQHLFGEAGDLVPGVEDNGRIRKAYKGEERLVLYDMFYFVVNELQGQFGQVILYFTNKYPEFMHVSLPLGPQYVTKKRHKVLYCDTSSWSFHVTMKDLFKRISK